MRRRMIARLGLAVSLIGVGACGDDVGAGADAAVDATAGPFEVCGGERGYADVAVPEQAPLGLVAVDGRMVWFSVDDRGSGSVLRAIAPGEPPAQTLYQTDAQAAGLATDGRFLYWVEIDGGGIGPGRVRRLDLEDPEVELLYSVVDADSNAVAVADGLVFWLTHTFGASGFDQTLWSGSTDGTAPPVAVGSFSAAVTLNVREMIARDGAVHWATPTGFLYRLSIDGSFAISAREETGVRAFDVTDSHFVYANGDEPADLKRVALADGSGQQVVAAAVGAASGLRVTPAGTVFSTGDDTLSFLPHGSATPAVLADGNAASTRAIVVDEQSVYWANTAFSDFGGGVFSTCLDSAPR